MCQNETYFDRALSKYGENNFKLEILEDNVFDAKELNEKECYYIEKFNTFDAGYNMNRGEDSHTRFNKEDRDRIVALIKNTNMSMSEIGEKTGYSIYTISDINNGYCLPEEGEEYPIRDDRCSQRYNESHIGKVVSLLRDTNFSFQKIADITQTNLNFVYDINRGKRSVFKNGYVKFPIREGVKRIPLNEELVENIVCLLKKNNMSAEEIGQELNIPAYTVGQINRGKHSFCKKMNETFPIRKKEYRSRTNYSRRKLSNAQLNEVIELLINTTLSTEEIARRYSIDKASVDRINRGATFKPVTEKYKLPIRQNKVYNAQIDSANE